MFRVELVIRGALRRFELFKRCIFRTFFNFESDNKRLLWVVFAYELIKPRNFFLASGSTILKVGEPQFKIFMTAKKSNLMKLTPNFKSALTQKLRVIFNLKKPAGLIESNLGNTFNIRIKLEQKLTTCFQDWSFFTEKQCRQLPGRYTGFSRLILTKFDSLQKS